MDSILRSQDGNIGVERTSGAGTLMSDRSADGGIMPANSLVSESERIRRKMRNRVVGKVEATGLPCSCSNGGTYRRGAVVEAPCLVCGGTRA